MVLMQSVLCIDIDLDIVRKNKNWKYIYLSQFRKMT